ncbi:MAG: membrane protein insertion efficiency factor YidD [Planctomycetota bacterium]|nr:membrane protein insertion efficiency factor YidD [Planctomycetota bacterium]
MKALLIGVVSLYQRLLSPLLPPSCRFEPSCSHYACDAIQQHGSLKGGLLAAFRVARCNPLCRGGADPVPPPGRWRVAKEAKLAK